VQHDSNRYEAEDMATGGYTPVDITPAETASGARAVICKQETGCTLSTKTHQSDGLYDIAVQYFDLRTGVSHYSLQVNDRVIATWASDDTLPPAVVRSQMDGQTSTRFTARSIELHHGDTLKLVGIPDTQVHLAASEDPAGGTLNGDAQSERRELAPVDYIELGPAGPITPQ
jgi:alpha-glucuronidase